MKEISTINFQDLETEGDALAVVRVSAMRVSLCVSLAKDGDIEVTFNSTIARQLSEALREAASVSVQEPESSR